jgi:cytochrome c553
VKKLALVAGATVGLLGVGGALFAWSGLYNVAATAGHWPPTASFLHFIMRSSVRTHAAPIEAPPLNDPLLIERGAAHYESGCRPCHGAPGEARNRIPDEMLPPPPYLPTTVPGWTAEELFWIIKHGLKYTGMPAWPAQSRDDEVWAVTAFLLTLPRLTAADYDRLALGASADAAGGEPPSSQTPGALFTISEAALIDACARCHGLDGSGRPSGAFPRLDIQTPGYLARTLAEYADDVRPSGIMQPIAAALDKAAIDRLAAHFGGGDASRASGRPAAGSERLAHGRMIAEAGLPESGAPACAACHGLAGGPANPLFPALAGQSADFIRLQVELWRTGNRGGGDYSDIMEAVVDALSDEDIAAVAAYYESLGRLAGAQAEPPR